MISLTMPRAHAPAGIRLLPVLLFLCVCCWHPAPARAATARGDWWMFHHDPQHTGRSLFTGPSMPMQKWAFATGDIIGDSSPVIGADGTVYIGSYDHNLYAVNADGTKKWEFATGDKINSSPAIGIDGTVYIGSNDSNLYAVNADGTQKWVFSTGGRYDGIWSHPVIGSDGTIYVGSGDYNLYAVNPNGTKKWAFSIGWYIDSSPVIGTDGTVYVGSQYGKLFAINPDGTKKWVFDTGDAIFSSPAIGADGTIYVGSCDTKLYAINPDGTRKWAFLTGERIDSSPAIGKDGTIYVGSLDHNVYAINPDGTEKWAFATGDAIDSSPALGVEGTIYVGSTDHNLYAINPIGTEKWAFATGDAIDSSPALGVEGTVYVGSCDHKLYAITQAPLTLQKSVSVSSAPVCSTVTYTLTAMNSSKTAVAQLTLSDALPAHISYVTGSASNGGNYQAATRTITWTPGTINAGASATVTFQATVDKGTSVGMTIDNRAAGNCAQAASIFYSNPATITVQAPVLSLTKSVQPTAVLPGNMVTYTLNAASTGTTSATKVTLTDVLPAQLTYVAGSASGGGIYHSATRTLTWALGTLNINSSATVTFRATVNAATAQGSDVRNVAAVSCAELPGAVTSNTTNLFVGATGHGDWWMFQHDPQHTGRSTCKGPAIPAITWVFTAGDYIISPPTFSADGTCYVSSMDGNLYAVNPDGTKKWAYPGIVTSSSPAIGTDGTIYVCSNKLYALNPDGTQQWAFAVGGSTSPAIGADGTIYIGSADKNLYAINPDGTKKWTFPTGDTVTSSPALGADGTIYIGSNDKSLYAINPNGIQKWTYATGGSIGNLSPAVGTDGTIYLGSGDKNLYALNANGTKKWAFFCGSSISIESISPAIGADGTIYVGASDNNLYALNPAGTKKWTFNVGYYITNESPIIGTDGTIYISGAGNLNAIDAAGTKKWAFFFGGGSSSPAIGANGLIYIGNGSRLLAIGSQSPALTLTKTVSALTAKSGDTILYTLDFSNYGTATGTNVKMIDLLPATLSYVPGSATGGGSYAAGKFTWTLGTVKVGTNAQVTFQAKVNAGVAVGTNIANTAAISCTEVTTPVVSNAAICTVLGNPIITPAAGANGSISPNVSQSVTFGSSVTFTAAANAGYTTDTWYLDNIATQIGGVRYALTGITANHTVKVTFRSSTGTSPARGDWWMLHHDPQHTSRSTFTGPASPVKKWLFSTAGPISSSPALGADGTVYVGSTDHNLYAINPDGTQKWIFPTSDAIASSPALSMDGTIYVGSNDGNLYAVNPDGTWKWAFPTGGALSSSPLLGADGTIYIGSHDGNLYAINPDSTRKWAFPTANVITSSPALDAYGTVYVGSTDHNLYAINPDGTRKWTFSTGGVINSSPAIGLDGTVYFSAIDTANFYAVTPNGLRKWTWTPGGMFRITLSPAIGADGTVYIGAGYYCYAITPGGMQVGYVPLGDYITTTPMLGADGTLYIGSNDKNLYAFNPDGGQKWTFPIGNNNTFGSDLTLGEDGVIYFGSWDGNLYAIGAPLLSLLKSVSQPVAISGSTVTYTLSCSNTGGKATGVTLTDSLPARVTFVPGSITGGGSYSAGKLTWNLGTMNAGASTQKLSFQAMVNANTPVNSIIANTATVACVEQVTPVISNAASFTVAANSQPDLAICNYGEKTYTGFTVINLDGTNQTKSQSVGTKVLTTYLFQVKNTGNTTDTFVLTYPVSATSTGWTIQVIDRGTGKDVTAAFIGSGYKVTLASGAMGSYTLHVTPSASVCGTLRLAITAVSVGDATKKDVVKAATTVAAPYQPDLSICNVGDSLYLGGGILSLDGTNQTKSQTMASGKTATYFFRVQNAGTLSDTYTLTCPLPSLSGWSVQVLDSAGKDVTATLAGAKTAMLAPGALVTYTLRITPSTAVASGKAYPLLITATSGKDATKKDAVKAVATKQ